MAAPQPQAAAPVAYTPVLTDLWRLIRAPFVPNGVFTEQRDKPTVWMPWVVLSVLFMLLGIVGLPVTVQVARVATEAAGRPFTPSIETITKVVAVGAAPVLILLGILLGAAVLYLSLLTLGVQSRFKGLMTVSVFTAAVSLLQAVVTTVALMMRGAQSIQSPLDARITFGLDNLVSPEYEVGHKMMAALLRGIGPFEIWALVITALGLVALERAPKNRAWTAAVIAFLIGLLIKMGLSMLSRGA